MFSQLRSRLIFTYSLVIIIVLGIVCASIIVYIIRNPTIDRQTFTRLEQTIDYVLRQSIIQNSTQNNISKIILRTDNQVDVRVLILSPEFEIIHDSRDASEEFLSPKFRTSVPSRRGVAEDLGGKIWQFVWRPLEDGSYLIMSTPRIPRISLLFSQRLRDVLKDDLLPPLIRGGFFALLIALVLSFWMANWISSPLKKISDSVKEFPNKAFKKVSIEGPEEVKSLSVAFNKMSDEVVASQQSQRDFVTNVSHELKTPLTSIQGFSQAIIDGTVSEPENLEQAAGIINNEAERMHKLVLELLDLARFEAGTIRLKNEQINVEKLLQKVNARFLLKAESTGVTLTCIQDKNYWITGDSERLLEVFSNLVDNAIKNTASGGSVFMETTQIGRDLIVTINDTGVGIPVDEKDRIFERFYQIDKSRSGTENRGSGLGLAISNEIILAHSGEISVKSKEGQGSSFMVKIPLKMSENS